LFRAARRAGTRTAGRWQDVNGQARIARFCAHVTVEFDTDPEVVRKLLLDSGIRIA